MYAPDASILHGKIIPARTAEAQRIKKISPEVPPPAERPRPSLMGRLFGRQAPTVFQRCLAVHIHHASQNGGMH